MYFSSRRCITKKYRTPNCVIYIILAFKHILDNRMYVCMYYCMGTFVYNVTVCIYTYTYTHKFGMYPFTTPCMHACITNAPGTEASRGNGNGAVCRLLQQRESQRRDTTGLRRRNTEGRTWHGVEATQSAVHEDPFGKTLG